MFTWKKCGLVFSPSRELAWSRSHAQLPTAVLLDERGTCRVYYASRNEQQRSHVGWFDIALGLQEPCVLEHSPGPVLLPGPPGFFDEHGVYPASAVITGQGMRLYFIGWNQGAEAPMFYAAIGLAESEDGGRSFRKAFKAPIMSRSEHDPCMVTSPNVILVDGQWRMSYVSGIAWVRDDKGQLKSRYHIKLADSDDGIEWRRQGRVAIDFANAAETNIARSSVVRIGSRFHMWFCYVNEDIGAYRIGYAQSDDGMIWHRDDKAGGLDVSAEGFDSAMTCYPSVVRVGSRLYMFYNGNRYGEQGVGLAYADIGREAGA